MSDTESSSTSILVAQRNEEDPEKDEILFKKAREASRVYNHHPLSNENDNEQGQAESINNGIPTILQPTKSSNLAPRKRGRHRKTP